MVWLRSLLPQEQHQGYNKDLQCLFWILDPEKLWFTKDENYQKPITMIFYIGIFSLLITLTKAQSGYNYIPNYNRPTYNCTIPRVIQVLESIPLDSSIWFFQIIIFWLVGRMVLKREEFRHRDHHWCFNHDQTWYMYGTRDGFCRYLYISFFAKPQWPWVLLPLCQNLRANCQYCGETREWLCHFRKWWNSHLAKYLQTNGSGNTINYAFCWKLHSNQLSFISRGGLPFCIPGKHKKV